MTFDALLGIRKPDPGIVQVVEAVGLLLGIENTGEDHDLSAALSRTVPPGSVYGPTLKAITRRPASEVLERLRLLDLRSISDEVGHEVFAKTLGPAFSSAGNSRSTPGLSPPWTANNDSSAFFARGRGVGGRQESRFGDSLDNSLGGNGGATVAPTTGTSKLSGTAGAAPEPGAPWNSSNCGGDTATAAAGKDEIDAAVHALKLAVVGVTQRLVDDEHRLPLRNRTTAVLVDGSRMSILALELAGATWKFGKFVVVHVSGERHPGEADGAYSSSLGGVPECGDARTPDRDGGGGSIHGDAIEHINSSGYGEDEGEPTDGRQGSGSGGRWGAGFLEAELREMCMRQLEIPEDSLELVFRSLPKGSPGTVDDVTTAIDSALTEHGVEVVFMGCYGRRGPRVSHYGSVARWALEHTSYQVVFAKKFSPSMVSPAFCTRPKRYLVAVTSDLGKVTHMLDRLLPLVSPRDSVILLHVVDEGAEDIIAGEVVDADEVKSDLLSLLSNKPELCYRVRVEKTGRPPECPTQTVVQRIVKIAEEEAADILAILHDESRGSYRTVATGCLRETRCGLIAIH